MWKDNVDALVERYKVYAVDLWGFGYSTRKPLPYGYALYTEQLLNFMDAMGIRKASLMGQSMGGGTIINFAVSNRERVEKAILVDPAGMPNRVPFMGQISNLPGIGEFMYGAKTNFVRKFTLTNNFLHNGWLTEANFNELMRFHKIKGTSEVMLQITRRQFFDTLIHEIRKYSSLDIPTLIVWGREERLSRSR
jgi:pimeloyl-ACP methyl ester carboxylesterase